MNHYQSIGFARYTELLIDEKDLFENPAGEIISVITDPAQVAFVELQCREKLAENHQPVEWADVGVVFEDQYIQILRDAVEFPGGKAGTYVRILPKNRSGSGAAILPICDGKLVLLRHFRHATRSFHWEIPRGFSEGDETEVQTASRELREEMGVDATELVALGSLHPDSGLMSQRVSLFAAQVAGAGGLAKGEGIQRAVVVDVPTFESLVANDEITDSFTLAAFFRARLRNLI
jgi:ADP-ribose pyrophosphatase